MASLDGAGLFDVSMTSPFILASGPLSYDATGLWKAYRAGAGGVVTKTLRLAAAVNPTPHMVVPRTSNLRATLFNSEKWADLTWQQWVEAELPRMTDHPGLLIASIGHTPPEGVIAGPVAGTGVVDAIECVAYTRETIVDLIRAVHARTTPNPRQAHVQLGRRIVPGRGSRTESGRRRLHSHRFDRANAADRCRDRPTDGRRSTGSQAWMSGAAIRPVARPLLPSWLAGIPASPSWEQVASWPKMPSK